MKAMTNKKQNFADLVMEIYELARKSESFRSLLGMGCWAVVFIGTIVATREIIYAILFSTVVLAIIMLGTTGDDDDDE
jgi:hypothetical protein